MTDERGDHDTNSRYEDDAAEQVSPSALVRRLLRAALQSSGTPVLTAEQIADKSRASPPDKPIKSARSPDMATYRGGNWPLGTDVDT
ncbi:MAG: hypothetical protein ACR2GH_17255 [Pseudonocardia sp.]